MKTPLPQVNLIPVEGCVVNWEAQIQVNPETGEQFEMDGSKIFDDTPVKTKPKKEKP